MTEASEPTEGAEREALRARLETCVRRQLGAACRVGGLVRLTGGAIKATWSFDVARDGEVLPMILQQAAADRPAADRPAGELGFPGVRGAGEAALLAAAAAAGVPVPRVWFVADPDDALGEATVTERVAGETLGRKIVADPRFAAVRPQLAAQCGAILAAIHRIDASGLGGLVDQPAHAQLAMYRQLADAHDHPLPALEAGLRWIADHLPATSRTTVVHGDFRTGNLVVGEDGVRCVLDWELAQRGDPMLDLGWLCVKTWRFGGALPVGGFGHRDELFAAYERAGGGPIDPAHVRFWEAFGCVKWAIMCLHKGLGTPRGARGAIEAVAIGRRIEEPLLDFLELITARQDGG